MIIFFYQEWVLIEETKESRSFKHQPNLPGSILTPENLKKWGNETLDKADASYNELLNDRMKYYERYVEG